MVNLNIGPNGTLSVGNVSIVARSVAIATGGVLSASGRGLLPTTATSNGGLKVALSGCQSGLLGGCFVAGSTDAGLDRLLGLLFGADGDEMGNESGGSSFSVDSDLIVGSGVSGSGGSHAGLGMKVL